MGQQYNEKYPLRIDFLDPFWVQEWIDFGFHELQHYLDKYTPFYEYLSKTGRL